jgi:hypothetical protein
MHFICTTDLASCTLAFQAHHLMSGPPLPRGFAQDFDFGEGLIPLDGRYCWSNAPGITERIGARMEFATSGGQVAAPGTFAPDGGCLGAFAGQAAGGEWLLTVQGAGQQVGWIESFDITFAACGAAGPMSNGGAAVCGRGGQAVGGALACPVVQT